MIRKSRTGDEIRRFVSDDQDEFTAIGFAHSGGRVAIGCDSGVIQLWSPRSKKPQGFLKGLVHGVNLITFHKEKPIVVAANHDGEIAAWVKEGRLWERLWFKKLQYDGVNQLVISNDGTEVAVVFQKFPVCQSYVIMNGLPVRTIVDSCSHHLAFSEWKGTIVAGSGGGETRVQTAEGKLCGLLPVELTMFTLKWTPLSRPKKGDPSLHIRDFLAL